MPPEDEKEKVYLCPQCGQPLETGGAEGCEKCGWKPRVPLKENEIFDLTWEQLQAIEDDGGNPNTFDTERFAKRLKVEERYVVLAKSRWLKSNRELATRTQQPAPQIAPQSQPFQQSVPDWILKPYTMQIDALTRENTDLKARLAGVEKELRDEIRKPRQPDEKWSKVEAALMEKMQQDILNPPKSGTAAPKSVWEEMILSLVQSGQMGNILTEVGGLVGDLRNRNNPEHDPYAEFYAQKAARQQEIARRMAARRKQTAAPSAAPAHSIKRRPAPPGVQPTAAPAPEPEQTTVEPEPVSEPIANPNRPPEPTEQEPEPEDNFPAEGFNEVEQRIYDQLVANKYDAQAVELALMALREEAPTAPPQKRLQYVVAVIGKLKEMVDVALGMKALLKGAATTEQAATFLMQRSPDYARLLVAEGFEKWLSKLSYFDEHPLFAQHIQFLNEPEVTAKMAEIVDELRKRLG